ncbi:putative transposase, IS605 OrfB family [Candidatus Nitrososphaera gargensis Ga9.2]|uniref:Putative transposase, IS605 OrfB family n=1 Tax=Nitrososphaera gargensis (strain Ga9.2) TaxID=1237085 RepID=K0ICW3_NITGG|nr:transposase [Candidatus Nitrososphaera gargensis]AFU57505.1 putative transposase, IS605 OrfB family [Candidatus Nitrososphaera gargensis Ga9.2]
MRNPERHSTIRYEKPVGIDVGITNYAYDSNGNHIDNPLFMSKELKPLRRAQRKVPRRQKGSKNYKKAVSWLQRLHMRIANKRKNFLHNLSTWYCRNYDLIFIYRKIKAAEYEQEPLSGKTHYGFKLGHFQANARVQS